MTVTDINPRPPRGGRRRGYQVKIRTLWISIHAPREGGDGNISTGKDLS